MWVRIYDCFIRVPHTYTYTHIHTHTHTRTYTYTGHITVEETTIEDTTLCIYVYTIAHEYIIVFMPHTQTHTHTHTGHITVEETTQPIKSISMQLVRVEVINGMYVCE